MKIETGFDKIPKPIRDFVRNHSQARPPIPHVFHVSAIVGCLLKEFDKRKHCREEEEIDIDSLFSIFRGQINDKAFTPLFENNQKTLVVTTKNVSIVGTYDFIYEGYLWDLKMPSVVYFAREKGAGKIYVNQVKSYLAMMHFNKLLLNVTKARVLMIAGDGVVREEVEGEDKQMLSWLIDRAVSLDDDITEGKPDKILKWDIPEEAFECHPRCCSITKNCPYTMYRELKKNENEK